MGATSLILTKLDEANGLGNVLPLVRSSGLPLSYLTDGQNVPDDIQTADARRLARMILAIDSSAKRLVGRPCEAASGTPQLHVDLSPLVTP